MQEIMELPYRGQELHPTFGDFFAASLKPGYICVQDGKHAVTKAAAAMKLNVLALGSYSISIAYLKNSLARVGRVVIGISEIEIEADKDAMNYDIAAKLCQPRVSDLLKGECEKATSLYLKMMHCLIKAYIDGDSTPSERLFNAWYCVFFCRYWKESLQKEGKQLGLSFISRNLHASIEINAHALVLFLIRCRDEETPELFLMHLANSQPCEEIFGILRTIATSFYTKINFNVKEALDSLKRVELVNEIVSTPSQFSYSEVAKKRARNATNFVPVSLPGDDEIREIAIKGNEQVKSDLQAVGIETGSGFPLINLTSPPELRERVQPEQIDQVQLGEDVDVAEPAFIEAIDDLQELLERIEKDPSSHETDGIDTALRIVPPEDIATATEKEALNFIFFARGEKTFKIPKSTVLFMISEKGNPVSVDRLQRFIVNNKKPPIICARSGRCDKINSGEWIVMNHTSGLFYCLVLGFRYTAKSGIKRKFKQTSCPVSKPGRTNEQASSSNSIPDQDVEVNVDTFTASTGGLLTLANAFGSSNNVRSNGFINIARYLTHANVERKTTTGLFFIR